MRDEKGSEKLKQKGCFNAKRQAEHGTLGSCHAALSGRHDQLPLSFRVSHRENAPNEVLKVRKMSV